MVPACARAVGRSPANMLLSETEPDEPRDSSNDIGHMRNLAILPVPEWATLRASTGTLEPVGMN